MPEHQVDDAARSELVDRIARLVARHWLTYRTEQAEPLDRPTAGSADSQTGADLPGRMEAN